MTALPNRHYSGHRRAIEIEDNQRTPGKEIWRKKCGQQFPGTAGGRWMQQHRTEVDGNK